MTDHPTETPDPGVVAVADPASGTPTGAPPRTTGRLPRGFPFFAIIAVAVIAFLAGGFGSSYQGKLSEVQKNDNSSFLPGSAESTRAGNEAALFTPSTSIPGFVVFSRTSGLTAEDRTAITAKYTAIQKMGGVDTNAMTPPTFAENGTAAASLHAADCQDQRHHGQRRPADQDRAGHHGSGQIGRTAGAFGLAGRTRRAPQRVHQCVRRSGRHPAAGGRWRGRADPAARVSVTGAVVLPALLGRPRPRAVRDGRLLPGQERRHHTERAKPRHSLGAGPRGRNRLCAPTDLSLPRRAAQLRTTLRRDDQGLEGICAGDLGVRGHCHPRSAVPDVLGIELQQEPRAGRRHRHRLHAAGHDDVPSGGARPGRTLGVLAAPADDGHRGRRTRFDRLVGPGRRLRRSPQPGGLDRHHRRSTALSDRPRFVVHRGLVDRAGLHQQARCGGRPADL